MRVSQVEYTERGRREREERERARARARACLRVRACFGVCLASVQYDRYIYTRIIRTAPLHKRRRTWGPGLRSTGSGSRRALLHPLTHLSLCCEMCVPRGLS